MYLLSLFSECKLCEEKGFFNYGKIIHNIKFTVFKYTVLCH